MNRRDFIQTMGILSAGLTLPGARQLFAETAAPTGWRTFEVTTHIEVLKPAGQTLVWVPGALTVETPFQKTLANEYEAPGGSVKTVQHKQDGLEIIGAKFPAGTPPLLTVKSRVMTRNYAVDLASPVKAEASAADLAYFRRPTRLLPTDGIVKQTAAEITQNMKTDVEKALAIYEWIVENTVRDPKTRGCGLGDIRSMLVTRDLKGK